jgi:two-component system, NtrC family, sensor kinase
MTKILRSTVDRESLDRLLGLESSKIGFYSEVKQKIQELEAANLGLRTKSRELQAVFNAISDGVAIYDSDGRVQYRNHVCPRMFPEETMIGSLCSKLFHPDQEAPVDCPVERALGGESVQVSLVSTVGGMETRYFDVTVTPIEENNGRHRALVFLRDVTDRRMQELQLVQAEKMSSIGVLAAGVAHEINNPLSSVAGYSEALLRRLRDDGGVHGEAELAVFRKYLDVIMKETYRCKGIIDSLLSFSRKSDGSMAPVDLNIALQEVLELVRHKSRYEQIEIVEALEPDLPPAHVDGAGLRQVFMNLLLNAHQAISGAGSIEISTCEEQGMGVIRIKDSGCGIHADQLAQIWNPFFTTKTVGQGLGLGLAITYNIVQRQGGEILVESQQGKGSTFTVRLPLCRG